MVSNFCNGNFEVSLEVSGVSLILNKTLLKKGKTIQNSRQGEGGGLKSRFSLTSFMNDPKCIFLIAWGIFWVLSRQPRTLSKPLEKKGLSQSCYLNLTQSSTCYQVPKVKLNSNKFNFSAKFFSIRLGNKWKLQIYCERSR